MFCCAAHGEIHAKAGTERDPKRVARWRAAMAERRKSVKAYKSRITSELMKARAETLKAISTNFSGIDGRGQKSEVGGQIVAKATAADFIFNLGNWAEALQVSLRSVARDALDTAGAQVFAEIGRDDPFKYPPEAVLEHLRTRQNYIAKASTSIWEDIKESIEEGLNAGDTQDQLAGRVRTAFNGVSDQRAQMIALTETGAAYGAGRDTAMRSAGIEYKQWLTSGNGNVRPAHLDAEGQTVRIEEPFNVGGEDLMHPGESGGSAENVINCHCISIAVEGP
jgi:SPP1 gp7 family putative phage head morphogenesis protein